MVDTEQQALINVSFGHLPRLERTASKAKTIKKGKFSKISICT